MKKFRKRFLILVRKLAALREGLDPPAYTGLGRLAPFQRARNVLQCTRHPPLKAVSPPVRSGCMKSDRVSWPQIILATSKQEPRLKNGLANCLQVNYMVGVEDIIIVVSYIAHLVLGHCKVL